LKPETATPAPSPTLRSVLSLALFIHCFCVAVVLGSMYVRSALQTRLVGIFGPYTEAMAFDPGQQIPYYYTHARLQDEDATLRIDLYPDGQLPLARQKLLATVEFPTPNASRWLPDHQRSMRLVRRLAIYADEETGDENLSSMIARDIGARVLREHGAGRAVVRCTRHGSRGLRAGEEPEDALVYEADVWIDETGKAEVVKRLSAAEVAPGRTKGKGAGGREAGGRTP
jgi:hypothetical protein